MRLEYYARTDVGRVRKENQDSYGVLERELLYYVCDGMGGGAAGDFASRAAAEIIKAAFHSLDDKDVGEISEKGRFSGAVLRTAAAVRLANRALSNFAGKYPRLAGMGTTFAGVLFEEGKDLVHIFHTGDSRVYRVRGGDIQLLTKDHSKINELIELGKMREDEVKTAEIQSMITRALGTGRKVKIDYKAEKVAEGDYFILCTDGLNGELDDKTIRDIVFLNRSSVELIAKELIRIANDSGGKDNTTVLAVKASGVTPENSGAINGDVYTFDEETERQTAAEDRILKKLLKRTVIAIPKAAKEKSLAENPLVLGSVIAAVLVGVSLFVLNMNKEPQNTKLMDLAGAVTGISLEVRTPLHEQIESFKGIDDTVQKLQMIQDWIRDKDKMTVPLENVQVLVEENGKEQYKGLTTALPVDIHLPRGNATIQLNYPGYRLIGERMEMKESVSIAVEQSEKYKKIVLLMIAE